MTDYITGIAYYPALKRPNKMTKKYSFDLGDLDKETVKKLKDAGVNTIKEDKKGEKGTFIQLSSPKYPARVFDSAGNELPDEVAARVGNGSKVRVPLKTYTTEYRGDKFTKVALSYVQVIDMVEYKAANPIEGGYVYDGPTKTDDTKDNELNDELPWG